MANVGALVRDLRNDRRRQPQLVAAKQLARLLLESAEQGGEGQLQLEYTDLHAEFLAAGGMQTVVRLLTSSQGPLKAVALELLHSACLDSSCADALAAAGGFEPLLQLLQGSDAAGGGDTRSIAIDTLACAATLSLAANEAAVAAGCVPLLVALVGEANGAESGAAAQALTILAPYNEQALLSSGAVAALVQLMQHQSCERLRPLHTLNRLTNQGSSPRAEAAAAVAAAGGIPAAVQCLQDESVPCWSLTADFTVPQLAAGLLGDIAEACPQLAAEICAAGAMPRLEHMLRHSVRAEERGWAANALVHLRRAAASAATGEAAVDPAQSASAPPPAEAPCSQACTRLCRARLRQHTQPAEVWRLRHCALLQPGVLPRALARAQGRVPPPAGRGGSGGSGG